MTEIKKIHENWLFFDTLSFIRKSFPAIGQGNYSLGKLYNYFFDKELENAHSSIVDVKALKKIFKHIIRNLSSEKLIKILKTESRKAPCYENQKILPITSIKGIGPYTALRFKKYYITTVENILEIFKNHNENDFDNYLKDVINISYENNRQRIIYHLRQIKETNYI